MIATDQIFCIWQILEKRLEYNGPANQLCISKKKKVKLSLLQAMEAHRVVRR
jgi:hypothetical protein